MTAKAGDGGELHLTRTGEEPRATEVDTRVDEGPGQREEVRLADTPPSMLGRYSLLRKLGEGGMGIVWSAYDEELDRKVAIKLMRVRGGGESTAATRMLHEARAMAMLSHPNVVHVYDVRVVGGQVFLAMEFVAGPTLREWLRGPGEAMRPWPEALAMYLQAGQGLAAAHSAGLVHRDFKPDNVLVGNDGRVRVVDFGLAARSDAAGGEVRLTPEESEARALELSRSGSVRHLRSDPQLTPHGTLLGTPAYMSPEQHLRVAADGRSDQYSFCVSLYEGLYGERPFAGSTSAEIRVNVLSGRLRDPPPGRKVPAWLRKVVVRGLCVAPEERYPSMEALLAALAADPGRVRRRRLAALGVAVLAGVAVAGQGRRPEVCGGDERALVGVWDEPRAAAVERALRATGLAYARDTWPRVQEQLDMYAGTWRSVRRDTCEATNLHGTQSAALMDVRMACLDRRRADLGAVVGVLAEADAQVAERAVHLVAELPAPGGCATATGELEGGDPAAVQAVREALSRARADEQAGRWVRGREVAQEAVAAAEATGVGRVLAEALMQRGGLEAAAGDYATAEATLTAAYTLAETEGHAEVKAEAATRLVRLVGDHRGRDGESMLWSRLAEAVLARRGDPRIEAELRQNLGIVHNRFGRYDEAEAALQRAIAVDHAEERAATYHRLVGNVHYRRGRYAEAQAEWERAIALGEAALGSDHPDLAKSITNLGEALRKQGQGARAREAFLRAIAVWEGAFGRESALLAAPLNGLGTLALIDGDFTTAVASFDRVRVLVERSSGPDHPDVGAVTANLGEALLRQGEVAQSRRHTQRALEILEKALGPDHDNLADALSNLGRADVLEGRFAEAEASYARAVKILERAQGVDFPELAKPLTGQGLLELARGRPEVALRPLERALTLHRERGRDPADLAELRLALARALWDSGVDRRRAHALAAMARATLAATLTTPPQATRLREIDAWLAAHPEPV
ncbi:MAG: tetratricopeptide repeat protein [Myxococcales bacterium]|nr:tetratricopeptide repeat protein [Myxococcales bacterium]